MKDNDLKGSMSTSYMSTSTSLHRLCRICAKYNDYLIPIFEGSGAENELDKKICKYFPFQISQNDGLPQHCCHECVSLIVAWNDLIECSERANEKLFNALDYHEEDLYIEEGDPEQEVTSNDVTNDLEQSETKVDAAVTNTDDSEDLNTTNKGDVQLESELVATATETEFYLKDDDDYVTTIHRETSNLENKIKKEQVVPELQPYKLHLPLKYITVNGRQYLRTKVSGFQITNAPESCDDMCSLYFTCCICKEIVKNEDVVNHSKTHYPLKKSDSCQICLFGFNSIDCFRKHLKKHTVLVDELYVKSADNVDKQVKEDLVIVKNLVSNEDDDVDNNFMSSSDNVEESLVCEYCGRLFNTRRSFLEHIRRIHLLPITCKICKRKFIKKSSLKNHRCFVVVDKGQNDSVSWYECKCKKIFLFKDQYLNHIGNCEIAKNLICQDCGSKFNSKADLDSHVLHQHKSLKKLEHKPLWILCEICGCQLSSVSAKKHYLTHSFTEKKYSCELCEKKFTSKNSLNIHMRIHSDLRPFTCPVCNVGFHRNDYLKLHLKNKHNISKESTKYKCRKCNRFFTSQSYLVRHQRLHSKILSYECPVCKTKFPAEHSLKMHQSRTNHHSVGSNIAVFTSMNTADWVNKYRCNICFQRYGSRTSLQKHILNHVKHKERNVNNDTISENINTKDNEAPENRLTDICDNNDENSKEKVDEAVYQCSKCSMRFLSEFGLKLHLVRTKHAPVEVRPKKKWKSVALPLCEKNPNFKCTSCGEMFATLLSLRMHKIKLKHLSQCPYCDKQFALDPKLRKHMIKVHNRKDLNETNELTSDESMLYQCMLCKQKFVMRHNWLAHMEKKHGKEVIPIQFV